MLPLIASAYKPRWEHGRAGKAAGFLCAVDPGGFEPEEGHDLHGDIEWYYVLDVSGKGTVDDVPAWTVTIYTASCPHDETILEKKRILAIKSCTQKAGELLERARSGVSHALTSTPARLSRYGKPARCSLSVLPSMGTDC